MKEIWLSLNHPSATTPSSLWNNLSRTNDMGASKTNKNPVASTFWINQFRQAFAKSKTTKTDKHAIRTKSQLVVVFKQAAKNWRVPESIKIITRESKWMLCGSQLLGDSGSTLENKYYTSCVLRSIRQRASRNKGIFLEKIFQCLRTYFRKSILKWPWRSWSTLPR